MKLTRASSYAVRALVHLARQPPGAWGTARGLAEADGISEGLLLKILKPPVAAGVLVSRKGFNGGNKLVKGLREITLLEVVEAADGPVRGAAPEVGRGAHAALDKRLQAVCDETAALMRGRLARVTLAELAKGK